MLTARERAGDVEYLLTLQHTKMDDGAKFSSHFEVKSDLVEIRPGRQLNLVFIPHVQTNKPCLFFVHGAAASFDQFQHQVGTPLSLSRLLPLFLAQFFIPRLSTTASVSL